MSSVDEVDRTLASLPTEALDATESIDPSIESEYDNSEDMPAISKEIDPEETKESADEGIFSIIYSAVKKVAVVGVIYLVGYMGWSIAWLITPVILSVVRDKYLLSTAKKRNIAKRSAMTSEKEVILARIDDLPAWVYFPDVERCEWINKILTQIWPNANHFARTMVKEQIEPKVAEALEKYKMNGFRFDRIILGTIPPRIGGVKVYDKNTDRNEIIMDLDLFYAGDCDINFYLSGLKGGIKDFQIHGWVRVVMKPLIRSIPLVGGLQIFFLNNPNIDFNLVGVIDLLDMPGLSDLLRRIIVEQIGAIMVLPNKLPIALSSEVPAISLKMPEPEGVLRIHVVEAKDLMKKDIGVLGKGKSDPYAVINIGSQEFKTQTIDNTVNPKWDYWCEGVISWHVDQIVEFNLLDKDVILKTDDWLGRASVDISNVVKRGVLDTWLTLEEAKHGLLHVRLSWYKLTTDPEDLSMAILETQLLRVTSMSTAVLIVFVDSAKNLPHPRHISNPDPYLVVSLGTKSEKTGVQLRNDSPVWEQGFTFLVSNPENDSLQLKIVDQKTNSDLGRYTYRLHTLLNKKNMEIVSQPFQLHKSGPESKIVMSLALRILKQTDLSDDSSSGEVLSDTMTSDTTNLSRTGSVNATSQAEVSVSTKSKEVPSSSIEQPIVEEDNVKLTSSSVSSSPLPPPRSPKQKSDAVLTHRFPETTSSAGEHGLGRIQLSIRYSVTRQRLIVTVHKIMNIPVTDPSNIPDPYVKLYLLPGRTKESKRKTPTVKDNCNPVYDATFEYIISSAELLQTDLEVTVCTQKGFLSGGSPVIGMLKISLAEPDISGHGLSSWFDLQPEIRHD